MCFSSLPFFVSHRCRQMKGSAALCGHTSHFPTFVGLLPSARAFSFQLCLYHFQMIGSDLFRPSSNAVSSVQSPIIIIAKIEFIFTSPELQGILFILTLVYVFIVHMFYSPL